LENLRQIRNRREIEAVWLRRVAASLGIKPPAFPSFGVDATPAAMASQIKER
jgi:hypothetical protein